MQKQKTNKSQLINKHDFEDGKTETRGKVCAKISIKYYWSQHCYWFKQKRATATAVIITMI